MGIQDEEMPCAIGGNRRLPLIPTDQPDSLLNRKLRWRCPCQTGEREGKDGEFGESKMQVFARRNLETFATKL